MQGFLREAETNSCEITRKKKEKHSLDSWKRSELVNKKKTNWKQLMNTA